MAIDDFLAAANAAAGAIQGAGAAASTIGTIGAGLDAAGDWLFGEDDNSTVDVIAPEWGGGSADPNVSEFGMGGLGAIDMGAAMANPAAQSAAMAIVRAVMGSDVVSSIARTMLDQLPGVIFDAREPSYQGSPLTKAMLGILFRQLSKDEQEAIIERLAGGQSPLSSKTGVRKNFRVLYVYDALRALNEKDGAEAIFFGMK